MSKVTFGCTLASSSLVFWLSFANILFLLSCWGRWSILPAAPMYLCRAISAGSSSKEHHLSPKPDFQQGEAMEERVFFPSFQRFENWTTQRWNNLKVDNLQLNQFEQKSVTNLFVLLEIPLDGHRGGGGTCWFLGWGKRWGEIWSCQEGYVGHSIIHWGLLQCGTGWEASFEHLCDIRATQGTEV